MDQEVESLLRASASEIRQLRQTNAILGAKVEMIDLFATVLHSQPARQSQGMGEDIAWKIDRYIDVAKAAEKVGTNANTLPTPPADDAEQT